MAIRLLIKKNKKARYNIWLFLWLTAWAGVDWQLTTWGCVLGQAQGLSLRVWRRGGGGLGTHGRMGGAVRHAYIETYTCCISRFLTVSSVVRHAYIETPKSPRVN